LSRQFKLERSSGGRSLRVSLGFAVLCFCALAFSSRASADVGVLLNESLDTSVARITGSGHTAVYFSRVCAETPVKLRLCRDGENGSVMSNYTTLGEDQPFEWNVVPLAVYLYGVEDPANRPLFASWKIKHVLEERYRDSILASYCATGSCRTSYKAEWREMVGATLERSMYAFVISTSVEQDQAFIEKFNGLANVNHFNGVTNNCANFASRVLKTYFPKSVHADYINDFGMTSPKAIARSFTKYGEHHPESNFYVLHFAQLPGTIKRSSECRSGTEQLYHSKKLLIPMAVFAPHELGVVAASYVLTGRFNPEHELERHPSPQASELDQEMREAKAEKDRARKKELQALISEQKADVVGASAEWKNYREQLEALTEQAVRDEVVPDREFLDHLFKFLDHSGTLSIDPDGTLWMELAEGGKTSRFGVSASNVFASGSDLQWAYAVTLARAEHYLNSPKHSRETMPYFRNDWWLLESAHASVASSSVTASAAPAAGSRASAAAASSFQP